MTKVSAGLLATKGRKSRFSGRLMTFVLHVVNESACFMKCLVMAAPVTDTVSCVAGRPT